jgi:hypothetical protein
MRTRLYALLISLFMLPFLVGGIFAGFYAGEQLRQAGAFGLTGESWAAIFLDIGLAFAGIYLGGSIAYAVFLFGATTFLSSSQIDMLAAQLPQRTSSRRNIFRIPFAAIGNFFWARER